MKAMDVKKEQKKRLLRAKIAVAIQDETGKAPTEEQINQVFFLSRVMWKAVLASISQTRVSWVCEGGCYRAF
jgi:hypothetical protein